MTKNFTIGNNTTYIYSIEREKQKKPKWKKKESTSGLEVLSLDPSSLLLSRLYPIPPSTPFYLMLATVTYYLLITPFLSFIVLFIRTTSFT